MYPESYKPPLSSNVIRIAVFLPQLIVPPYTVYYLADESLVQRGCLATGMPVQQHVRLNERNCGQLVSGDIGVELLQINQVLPQRCRHN